MPKIFRIATPGAPPPERLEQGSPERSAKC